MKEGEYIVSVDDRRGWDGNVVQLRHKDYNGRLLDFKEADMRLGIDSGQVGIFPLDEFRNGDGITDDMLWREIENETSEDRFYSACCKITLGLVKPKTEAGILRNSVISASGYGDGEALLMIAEKDGEVVAMDLYFGSLEEDEDEEETCYDCGFLLENCVCNEDDDEDEE